MTAHDRALELLKLALRDQNAARVLHADSSVDAASIGFHYQQAAEKLLKALLAERDVDFPRTHDLEVLAELIEATGYTLPIAERDLIDLSPFAVTLRYEADEEEPQYDLMQAKKLVQELRVWVETELA